MGDLLQDFAAEAAQRWPDRVALSMRDESFTYAELEQLSDRLAARLVEAGLRPGDRVALLIPKRPMTIIAMQAVMKAGGVYVPLDSESPAARVARIITSAEPFRLLAVAAAGELLDELAGTIDLPPVWSVEAAPIAAERVGSELDAGDWDVAAEPPRVRVGDLDPAHLIFTSGSTGEPKGVIVTHRMVRAFAEWFVRYSGLRETDRISGHPPLHFDLSTLDVYTSLAGGAELNMVPPDENLDPRGLAQLIRDRELTQWVSVPSVLTYMAKFKAVGENDFPALERVLWCGEVLPTPVLAEWMRLLPHVAFTNLYGPTEAAVASSYYPILEVPADESVPIPIGVACEGEELLVLDEELAPAASGEIGDLYIGGVGLSPGYWRDPEKTAAAFVPDPRRPDSGEKIYKTGDLARVDEDGVFHFLGRADSQIKSRGYRIELGEIESALTTIDGVRECAVVAVDASSFESVAICAAYVADGELSSAELREKLADLLPSYMLPARWLGFDALPKNQNDKVDRPLLREQFSRPAAERRKARK